MKAYMSSVVAPRVGAWIETRCIRWARTWLPSHPVWVRGLKRLPASRAKANSQVAPRVGAWIETISITYNSIWLNVAPRVGAWIETVIKDPENYGFESHPVWVRGLKHVL